MPKEYFWCCVHSQISQEKEKCQHRKWIFSPCCMHSAATMCPTCTFIYAYRAIMVYGLMSLVLIKLINSNFTQLKGYSAIAALPIGIFMAVGWVGQQLARYLPRDYIMYVICLVSTLYYCFINAPYKNPRKIVEIGILCVCYLWVIGKASQQKYLKSGASAIAGCIAVLLALVGLAYRNKTLEKRLLLEPKGYQPANSSNQCCVCKHRLASCILFPCLHSCYCYDCAHKSTQCLVCRSKVRLVQRTPV